MPQRLKTALLPLFCVMLLTGCGARPLPMPQFIRSKVPDNLLIEQKPPAIPSADTMTQRDVAAILVGYDAALARDNAQLRAIKALQQQ